MSIGIRIVVHEDGKITIETGNSSSGGCSQRTEKGKSLLLSVKDFTAIDLETTGLSPDYDSIIELAAIRYRDGKPTDRYSQLVNPGFGLDEFITELTGITDDMLEGSPEIEKVLPDYLSFIGDDIIVGHNVNFDVNFVYDNCINQHLPPFRNDFIDTMRMARRLHKDWPNHKLDTMLSRLDVGDRTLHRALNDTELTAECYLQMTNDPNFAAAMSTAWHGGPSAKDIVAQEGFLDESSPLFGKVCVFTGALEGMTRKEAMQIVANIGGICGDGVTKKTNYLILGNNDYCASIKDGKSSKQKKAEKLILEGADLQIIPESVFFDMISSD